MTDTRIGTSAEQPINSDGTPAAETATEADPVGLDSNGEIVAADAATGTAIHAVGVALVPVDDETSYPSGQFEYAANAAAANRASIQNGAQVGYVKYGVEIINEDEDWGFDPGEPVYLAEGGGYTQTEPSDTGDLIQALGQAGPDGESVFLDVESDYDEAA